MYNAKECPYCGDSMEVGRVEAVSSSGLFWIPQGQNLGFFRTKKNVKKIGGLILDGLYSYFPRFSMPSIKAFHCESCKKIVIEL